MIWKKYFLLELIKILTLFIGSLYFLYVLIDFSTHTKIFQNGEISFHDLMLYYAWQFTKQADVLIPVALLVSTIKVLTTSNLRHEILALTTAGISYKKILSPFLWTALACTSLLYMNFQFLQPSSVGKITAFETRFFKDRGKMRMEKKVNALIMHDHSLLLYQTYDADQQTFSDLFWLKNNDEMFRIHNLSVSEKVPLGKYVDVLLRSPQGELVNEGSFDEKRFPEMPFDNKALFNVVNPPHMQSISELAYHLGGKKTGFGLFNMSDREAEAATFFYFKLTVPLVCFLAILGPAPFCLRCTRHLPLFFIYAVALFGIIAFFTLINAFVVLGESQVLPPVIAILLPQTLCFPILGKYAKL